jgi:GNAT superfamily N-acetyltransferase
MKIGVRRAKRGDYRAICALFLQGDRHHARALPGEYRIVRPARSRRYIDRLIADRDTLVLVAEREGEVVGIAVANVSRLSGGPRVRKKVGNVDSIVVDEAHRRVGIGSLLMRTLEAWARKKKMADLRLSVIDANPCAFEFYAALGYQPLLRRLVKGI